MIRRWRSALLAGAILAASPAAAQGPDLVAIRDQSSRLAAAVLGQVCLLNLGDLGATLSAAAPGGEFGFVTVPPEVASALLNDRPGHVRVLRRAGLGAVTLLVGTDGGCSVLSEYAEARALTGYLQAMIERGGLKGAGSLQPLEARDTDGIRITDYVFYPADWYAAQLAGRFGGDGRTPLAVVSAVSPPGRAGIEAVLSVRRRSDR